MKIDRVTTHHVSVPLGRELHTAIHRISSVHNVLVEIEADGLVGFGYAFTFNLHQARAVRHTIHGLAELIRGEDSRAIRSLNRKMTAAQNFVGTAGISTLAQSAIDVALWDLQGKRAGMPLFRLWGGDRDALTVYATGGWISSPVEDLIDEAEALIADGFEHYKIKIGFEDWHEDVRRFERLIGAVGERLSVMVDANQAWRTADALAAGREFERLGAAWYEEPVDALDVAGSAELARELVLSIATGETIYGVDGFRPLVEARAADVLMPDIMRVGGPTGFFDVATFADAHRQQVSSHTFTEVSAHVMSALPNAGLVEYIPAWWDGLFEDAPRVSGGRVRLTDLPGFGLSFAPKALRDWSIDDAVTI